MFLSLVYACPLYMSRLDQTFAHALAFVEASRLFDVTSKVGHYSSKSKYSDV